MKHTLSRLLLLLCCCFLAPVRGVQAQTTPPVVHAVLFYSPTCPHCHEVINGTLLPMIDKYGSQLQIIGVDVTQPQGQKLFLATVQQFQLEQAGVPFLVIDDIYLIGSVDIPAKFPALVEDHLAQGGVALPAIPGLQDLLNAEAKQPEEEQATPTVVPVARAVLFYRSSCVHCQQVVEEVIPPLIAEYGSQLELFGVDVSTPEGDQLYDAAIARFNIQRFVVPTLIMGDQVLLGGTEIKEKFPGIIADYLAAGGVDWAEIDGLTQAMEAATTEQPSATTPTTPDMVLLDKTEPTWQELFIRDPAGNIAAVAILIAMLGIVFGAAVTFPKMSGGSYQTNWSWLVPALCFIGMGVAGYLSYVEITQADAVCGPVGDCNTVQQSPYARLFGILPVGVLGLLGYIIILSLWFFARSARVPVSQYAALLLFVAAAFGILFSIYLTFLEPFVIGATCAWCLSSAVLISALFLLSLKPAKSALLALYPATISHRS